jgi:hypothetical protein
MPQSVFRGVGTPTSGRFWGRAGFGLVAAVALAAGCATAPTAPTASPARSVGSAAKVTTSTESSVAPFLPPPVAAADESAMPVAPAEFTGPPPTPQPPAPQLAQPPAASAPTGTGVWSVVIGINDYPGVSHDLNSARNDAADMDAALARFQTPGAQRVVLSDGQASADTIRRSLDWLVAHSGPEATAVFFFAGHVRKLSSRTEALVGSDGRTVSDTEVADRLAGLRGRAWIVIAGCYGGGFTEVLAPGRILTGAAPANRVAYESNDLRRSYLGEYLTHRALLQGKADASVEQAFGWALAALQQDHPDRLPVQYDQFAGDMTLRTSTTPPAKPQPTAPSSERPPPSTTTTTAPPRNEDRCLVVSGSLVTCGS